MLLQTKESLEELIVRTLAASANLTATQIKERIPATTKGYSIQAVYKELRKLRSEGVIVKLKQKYSLRLPWALDFIALADTISSSYVDAPSFASIAPERNKRKIWRFNNLLKLNDFWSHVLLLLINQSQKKILLGWNPHPWFHLVQTKQEEQYLRALAIAKGRLYLIIGGSTYLDKWTERFFDKRIVTYSFARSPFQDERSTYLNIVDDYVLTVKLNNETTEAIENLYRNTTSPEGMNFPAMLAIFYKKVNASIWLEQNHRKAAALKSRFSRFFGERF